MLAADLTKRADVATIEARLAGDPAISMLVNDAGMSLTGTLFDSDTVANRQGGGAIIAIRLPSYLN